MDILTIFGGFANLAGIGNKELKETLEKDSNKGEDGKVTLNPESIKVANKLLEDGLKAKFKKIQEDKLSQGFKEGREDIEKYIKKNYGFTLSLKSLDTLDGFITAREQAALENSENKNVLTKENAKENPVIQELLREHGQKITDKLSGELEAARQENTKILREQDQGYIYETALGLLDQANAKLKVDGKVDPTRVKTVKLLVDQLPVKVKKTEDGKRLIIPVDSKGNPATDPESYNPVTFKDLVLKECNPFGIEKLDPTVSSPSPSSQPPAGGKKATDGKYNFNNQEEFTKFVMDPKNRAVRNEAREAWHKKQAESKQE